MKSKSIIIFYLKFFADVEIIVETIIILIDYAKATIGRRDFQRIQEMPLGASEVVGLPFKDDAIGNEVEGIIATTNALIARLQQMFMLVDHAKAEVAFHCDDKLGEVQCLHDWSSRVEIQLLLILVQI